MMLAPAVVIALNSGDDSVLETKRKEAVTRFGGTIHQIGSHGAHLKIRPTKVIELYAKKGLIDGNSGGAGELLEAAYNFVKLGPSTPDASIRLETIARKFKVKLGTAREMLEEVIRIIDPTALKSLPSKIECPDTRSEVVGSFVTLRGPVMTLRESAKENVKAHISQYLTARGGESLARVEVTLDSRALDLMEQYVAFSCNTLPEQARILLKAACLSNGGTLWKIEKFSNRIGVEFPRGAAIHAQRLVDQGLLLLKGRDIASGTFSVDPIVQTLIAAELVNAKRIDTKTGPELEAAMSSLCKALSSVLDGDPTTKDYLSVSKAILGKEGIAKK